MSCACNSLPRAIDNELPNLLALLHKLQIIHSTSHPETSEGDNTAPGTTEPCTCHAACKLVITLHAAVLATYVKRCTACLKCCAGSPIQVSKTLHCLLSCSILRPLLSKKSLENSSTSSGETSVNSSSISLHSMGATALTG